MTTHTPSLDLQQKEEQLHTIDITSPTPIPSPLAEILLKILARLQAASSAPAGDENSN